MLPARPMSCGHVASTPVPHGVLPNSAARSFSRARRRRTGRVSWVCNPRCIAGVRVGISASVTKCGCPQCVPPCWWGQRPQRGLAAGTREAEACHPAGLSTRGTCLSWRHCRPSPRQAHGRREGRKAASTGNSVSTSTPTNQDCQRPWLLSHGASTSTSAAGPRPAIPWATRGQTVRANPHTPRQMVVLWTPHQRPKTAKGTFHSYTVMSQGSPHSAPAPWARGRPGVTSAARAGGSASRLPRSALGPQPRHPGELRQRALELRHGQSGAAPPPLAARP